MVQFSKIHDFLTRLKKDVRGGVMVYTAMILPVAVGSIGLAVDVASWHLQAKSVQAAADAAAMGAALEIMRTSSTNAVSAGHEAAGKHGFVDGVAGASVVINNPPQAPSVNAGAADSAEAIVRRPASGFLSGIFGSGGEQMIEARAVAQSAINDTCIWVLSKTAQGALTISGTANVNLECGAFSNSAHNQALIQTGSSTLTTTKIKTVGVSPGVVDNGGILGNPVITTGVSHVSDPLAWLPAPAYDPTCDKNGPTNTSTTFSPQGDGFFVICGKITVNNGVIVEFNPGIYVLQEVSMVVHGGGTLRGTAPGVHFYITPFGDSNDVININGGAIVDLETDNQGPLAGILFYHDRNSLNVDHSFLGAETMDLLGILYFPNQHVKFAGGSGLDATQSLLLVDTVDFSGNTNIGEFGGTSVAANSQLIQAKLIE